MKPMSQRILRAEILVTDLQERRCWDSQTHGLSESAAIIEAADAHLSWLAQQMPPIAGRSWWIILHIQKSRGRLDGDFLLRPRTQIGLLEAMGRANPLPVKPPQSSTKATATASPPQGEA